MIRSIRCLCLVLALIRVGLNSFSNFTNAAYITKICIGPVTANIAVVIISMGYLHASSYDKYKIDKQEHLHTGRSLQNLLNI